MNCAYHTRNPAVVQCNRCARPLCPACDHRIKGFPFCQDCIVTGVEMLRQQEARPVSSPISGRRSSPVIATLLSFICPGLGAAYNGQTAKALVHFAIFASFFQMAIVTDGQLTLFILGFIGTWLYAAVDACRTAQLIRSGLAPDAEEDAIARRLYGNPFAWSITLLVLGIIFFLHTMLGIVLPVKQFLPVALILLGAYMLFDYIRRHRKRDRDGVTFDLHRRPPSVVSASLDAPAFQTGEIITQVSARQNVEQFPFVNRQS